MNSAASRMYWAATPARTMTRYRAAWTTFLVVTTLTAAATMTRASTPKAMFWAM